MMKNLLLGLLIIGSLSSYSFDSIDSVQTNIDGVLSKFISEGALNIGTGSSSKDMAITKLYLSDKINIDEYISKTNKIKENGEEKLLSFYLSDDLCVFGCEKQSKLFLIDNTSAKSDDIEMKQDVKEIASRSKFSKNYQITLLVLDKRSKNSIKLIGRIFNSDLDEVKLDMKDFIYKQMSFNQEGVITSGISMRLKD